MTTIPLYGYLWGMATLLILQLTVPPAIAGDQAGPEGPIILPAIISDNMVVQQGKKIPVWGWSRLNRRVSVELASKTRKAKTDRNGYWKVELPPLRAGGPYTLRISTGNYQKTVQNILVGDVWLAGGQSNMEWNLEGVEGYEGELEDAELPGIRFFEVDNSYSATPLQDLQGGEWRIASAENAAEVSGLAWYFAKKNHTEKEVPVGVIDVAVSGSPAQAWIDPNDMMHLDAYADEARSLVNEAAIWQSRFDRHKTNQARKLEIIQDNESFRKMGIHLHHYYERAWPETELPGEKSPGNIVWFRKRFDWPAQYALPAELSFGEINDTAWVFLNGKEVAFKDSDEAVKVIDIDPALLRKRNNAIAVRILNSQSNDVALGTKGHMWLKAEDFTLNLEGEWYYNDVLEPALPPTMQHPERMAGVLYNAMIHPIQGIPISGFLWYQGESNVNDAATYAPLFKTLLASWRLKWNNLKLPFLYVQLANYGPRTDEPTESRWAELRFAQTQALDMPQTGMAVTIDIGDADDIHPRNKKAVAERLWRLAEHLVYGDRTRLKNGPLLKRVKKSRGDIVLEFDYTGPRLSTGPHPDGAEGTTVSGFEIATRDEGYRTVDAEIRGTTVVLQIPENRRPVSIRYAWADNPDSNLYNAEGLPASPFQVEL